MSKTKRVILASLIAGATTLAAGNGQAFWGPWGGGPWGGRPWGGGPWGGWW